MYWAHTYEDLAYARYGFTHPDQFWTLTFREFRKITEGIRKSERRQLETQAHFVRILISRFPFQGKRKPPSIEKMIGHSEEEMAEMAKRAKDIKRKSAQKREQARSKKRVDIS